MFWQPWLLITLLVQCHSCGMLFRIHLQSEYIQEKNPQHQPPHNMFPTLFMHNEYTIAIRVQNFCSHRTCKVFQITYLTIRTILKITGDQRLWSHQDWSRIPKDSPEVAIQMILFTPCHLIRLISYEQLISVNKDQIQIFKNCLLNVLRYIKVDLISGI